jgi:hypothetical protein
MPDPMKARENVPPKASMPFREQKKSQTAVEVPPPPKLPRGSTPPVPQAAPAPAVAPPRDETLARWARDLLDEARDSQYGDMVMQSPALRQGLEDLRKLLAKGDAGQRRFSTPSGLARWAEGLRPSSLPKLPDLSWMKLHKLFQAQPKLRLPSVALSPSVPRLALGLPRWGASGPSGRTLERGLLWVALLGAGALVCWQVMRHWSGAGGRRSVNRRQLGPWPVNPMGIMTPAELIQAFEYLSLLRLGPDSRSWNHRMIAAHLGGQNHHDEHSRLAADELAALYERARYAPATDRFPAEALASARRNLCILAGVASP